MSEDKKKDEQQKEVKQPTDVNVDLSLKSEQIISNGTVEKAEITDSVVKEVNTGGYREINITNPNSGEQTKIEIGEKGAEEEIITIYNGVKGLTLDDLHTVYAQNGNSASAAYNYLTTYLKDNKNDPEAIQNTVSMLLGDLVKAYDHNKEHRKVGIDQVDVLDKILSTDKGDEVPALICGTIHDFAAQALEDCGIKACLLTGGQLPDGDPHATLLYDRGDGKYVWNNYSKSMVIDAPSIKDAAREVYKKSGSLESAGMITFKDKDNSSYQEYAFKDEAAFGKEIDKRAYNSVSPFDNTIAQRPSIDASVTTSNLGNVKATAGGTLAYGNDEVSNATSLNLEFKNNNETSMFTKSQSVGLKLEHSGETSNGLYYDAKGVVSYTKGKTSSIEYVINTKEENNENVTPETTVLGGKGLGYATVMVHADVGKKTTLVENKDLKLTNVGQASVHAFETIGLGNISKSASVDRRITIEEGFGLENNIGNVTLNNNINTGGVLDFTHTCDGIKPDLGLKLNAGTGVEYNPASNLSVGANVKGYSVFTKSSNDYGVSGEVHAKYSPNSKVSLFGSANVGVEQQNLSIGLFNQKTENNLTLSTTLGAQLNKNTTVYANYTRYNDNINATRNYNQFEVGAKFNF